MSFPPFKYTEAYGADTGVLMMEVPSLVSASLPIEVCREKHGVDGKR